MYCWCEQDIEDSELLEAMDVCEQEIKNNHPQQNNLHADKPITAQVITRENLLYYLNKSQWKAGMTEAIVQIENF